MSKAVLVLDMPEGCNCCKLSDCTGYAPFCRIKMESYLGRMDKKPDWCPLRTVPERDKKQYSTGASNSYRNGWNACIDAILGN